MAGNSAIGELTASGGRRASLGRRIGLAATTGAAAKGLALAAQVLAVAVAVRALGAEGFALYVVIASLVSWIGLVGLGVAPGLTLGVARAAAKEDHAETARLFVVAFVLMVAIATLLVGGAVLLGATGTVERLIAAWQGPSPGDASGALLCMTILIAVQLVVVVPEAAQLGLQSQHVSNTWAGVGSAAAIAALLTVGGSVNSVTAFVLISQAPQIVARTANGIFFVLAHRFVLRPEDLRFRQHARPILGSGIAFAGFSLASYLGLQIGLLVTAVTLEASSVALAGVIVRGYLLEVSGLTLVTTPTWPAIANAMARGDLSWVRRTHRLLSLGAIAYCSTVAVVIVVGLETLIEVWTGTRPPDNLALRVLLAILVVVNGWAHVSAITLVGLGALRFTAFVLIAEAVIILALQLALVPVLGVTGYVGALTAGAVCVTGWVLPARVRRELARERG